MIDAQQVREIAAAAMCCERAIRRVYDPRNSKHKPRAGTIARVTKAARELGIPLPPQPEPQGS